MRRPHLRPFVLTLAVLATVVMFTAPAGCSRGPTGTPRPAGRTAPASGRVTHSTLARALDVTRGVESGRLHVATVLTHVDGGPDPPPGGRLTVARYRVAFDLRARVVEVQTDLSGVAAAVVGADAAAGDGRFAVAARMVASDDAVYAQGGPMAAALGRGPSDWVTIERAAFVDREPSSDAAALLRDPLGPFDVLGDAAVDARVVGHDVIRGSPATHLATTAGSAGAAAPVDVWIDADGVIRRMEVRLGGGVRSAGQVVVTVELFDVGAPVDITPPGGER
jgi:hypothetical protein